MTRENHRSRRSCAALAVAIVLASPLAISCRGSATIAPEEEALAPASRAGERSAHEMEAEVDGQKLGYVLHLPGGLLETEEDGRRRSADGWPLLLFLHGAGERGDDLKRVVVHGPPRLVDEMEALQGCVVLSPQCPRNEWWRPATLRALLDEVLAAHPRIDRDRLYVTGLSMGGYGTWSLVAEYPDLFAAAIPICGGGSLNRLSSDYGARGEFDIEKLKRARDLPIWAFHGDADEVVPVGETLLLVEALRETGRAVKLTVYPDVGHDSWTRTYADPSVYAWLLRQRRR